MISNIISSTSDYVYKQTVNTGNFLKKNVINPINKVCSLTIEKAFNYPLSGMNFIYTRMVEIFEFSKKNIINPVNKVLISTICSCFSNLVCLKATKKDASTQVEPKEFFRIF